MGDRRAGRRVLMICLDATESSLVERWARDGTMPNLGRLIERGTYGRLESTAGWFGGAIWATFFTGTDPAAHGFYHYLQWRPETMSTVRPSSDWLPLQPFWRDVGRRGGKVIALDAPLVYAPTEPFDGFEISGWANHDLLDPLFYHPPSLKTWVDERFGGPPREDEDHFLTPPSKLIATRDSLVAMTPRITDLAAGLMERAEWDLTLVCYSTTHRAGHKFWSLSGVAGDPTGDERAEIGRAMRDVYAAADEGVGRLVRQAGEDATVIVFALHGMKENTCRTDILSAMLEKVMADEDRQPAGSSRRGALDTVREAIPMGLRNRVKRALPDGWQDRLTSFWRTGAMDWSKTRAFPLVSDPQGCIRINLKGREMEGVVEPGGEYDSLCVRIIEGLRSFVDAGTGEPVAAEIVRTDELYRGGARRDLLPDIVVRWSDAPAAGTKVIVSPRYGTVRWPMPGRNQSGRSGNHSGHGYFVAAGGGIPPGGSVEGGHILDLAPTACRLLGMEPPASMTGRELFGGGGTRP